MPYIDIDSARKAGYSDDDIVKRISQRYPGVSDAIGKGYALDEIVNRINKREGTPTEPQAPEEKPPAMPLSESRSLFPSTAGEKGVKASFLQGLDLMGAPVRAGGTYRTNPETGKKYDIADPKSAFFRPEMEKLDKAISPNGENSWIRKAARGAVEVVGTVASDPTMGLATLGSAIKTPVEKAFKTAVEAPKKLVLSIAGGKEKPGGLTGVSQETLKMASTKPGRILLESAAGTEYQQGQRLAKIVDNYDNYLIKEKSEIKEALDNMPKMKMNNIIQEIDNISSSIIEGSPSAKAAKGSLENLKKLWNKLSTEEKPASKILNSSGKPYSQATKEAVEVDPTLIRELRIQLDGEIKRVFDKDKHAASILEKAGLKLRTKMKNELIGAAKKSGNSRYVTAMEDYTKKLDVLDDIKEYLGGQGVRKEERAQRLLDNLFGKNKEVAQRVLKDLEKVTGKNIIADAKLAQMAEEIGDKGKGAWLPQYSTGKSLWSKGAGLAIGSPRIATRTTLPAMQGLENFGKSVGSGIGKSTEIISSKKGLPAIGALLSKKDEEEEKKKKRKINFSVYR